MSKAPLLLAFIALAGGVITAQAPQARDKNKRPNQAADAKQAITAKVESDTPAVTIQQTFNEVPSKKDQQGEAKKSAEHPHDSIDWVNAFSTCVIAVFTVLLFFAVVWQIKTSRDIERGWVLIKRVGSPPSDWVSQLTSGFVPGIVFEFTVSGNTPVRIVDASFVLRPVPAKAGSGLPPYPDLPLPPDYSNGASLPELAGDGVVLAPGGTFQVRRPLIVTRVQADDMVEGRLVMCGYGILVYEDAFRQKRETAVCYVYEFAFGGIITAPDGTVLNPPGFRVGGPSEYNRAS